MFPAPETARRELELAAQANPGLWVRHSQNTGEAARRIAARWPRNGQRKSLCLRAAARHRPAVPVWRRCGTSSTDMIMPWRRDGTRWRGSA